MHYLTPHTTSFLTGHVLFKSCLQKLRHTRTNRCESGEVGAPIHPYYNCSLAKNSHIKRPGTPRKERLQNIIMCPALFTKTKQIYQYLLQLSNRISCLRQQLPQFRLHRVVQLYLVSRACLWCVHTTHLCHHRSRFTIIALPIVTFQPRTKHKWFIPLLVILAQSRSLFFYLLINCLLFSTCCMLHLPAGSAPSENCIF